MASAIGVVIQCEFEEPRGYTCRVAEIVNPEVADVTEITGDHFAGQSNVNVGAFISSDNAFIAFPKNLESFFPNLTYIILSGGRLTTVSSEDLLPWPNLSLFSARENIIETVDGNLFQNSLRLTWIELNSNLIQNVGANLLSNLSRLRIANFVNNTCIDDWAEGAEEIDELKLQLVTQCPPLGITQEPETTESNSSTTLEYCTAECSINEEADDLRARIESLESSRRRTKTKK